jgi:alkylation response protein AidB-like acyl-CoA dehydrogenase
MDFELNDEQRAFQQSARDFARSEIAPHAAAWDAEATFPRGTLRHAGELGFCGLYAIEAHGGLGLSRLDATLVLSGSKAFISGAGATDALVVMARTGNAGAGGISAFLVGADSAGIHYGRNEEKLGWHSQPHAQHHLRRGARADRAPAGR